MVVSLFVLYLTSIRLCCMVKVAYQFRSHVALHKRICGNDSAQDLTGKVIVIETQYRIKFFTTQKIIVHERCLATSMKNR